MTTRASLGLVGLLAVLLIVGGDQLGRALYGGLGALVGLVAGFLLSGVLLRAYFVWRDRAIEGG